MIFKFANIVMSSLISNYNTIIFTIFQGIIFISAINVNSRFLSILLLTYFYYSTFTGWHECVHIDFSTKKFSIYKFIGMINMVPLLVLNYKEKLKQHIDHHKYTNDKLRDPDYKTNNLIIFSKKNFKRNLYRNKFDVINYFEIFFKSIFILLIFKFWIFEGKSYDFIFSYILGNFIVHLIVNLLPHYKSVDNYGRNFKNFKFINFLLLGNNLHGYHHKNPIIPWYILANS